jgi:4-amino-4-deoxy-L-arabinose transferase-like glycosyltransferase
VSGIFNRTAFLALLLALFAFALRVFQLDKQSFWYDEAFSVYLSRFDLATITARTAADIQPPLYYYLLNLWLSVAGDSEFAVRFLSLFFGVLTIPLLYVTARRLFSVPAALFSALIATVSALYLWYSQEARMYTLITFLGLVSTYALVRALTARGSRRRWWLLFISASIAGVYTHYFAFALLAFQTAYAVYSSLTRRERRGALKGFFVSLLLILVAFVPWVPFMLNRLGEDASYFRGDLKLDEAVRHILISFSVGESVLESIAQYLAVGWLVVLVIALAALLLAARASRDTNSVAATSAHTGGVVFAALYLLIPLVLLLLLFSRNPKFNARYLMLASPGLYLLLGAGLGALWSLARTRNPAARVAGGVVLAIASGFLLLTSLYAVTNAYFDPAFTKADFRGVARHIAANAQDDEAVILTSGHLFPAFDYYFREANLPELRLPDDATLNADNVLNFNAANELNRALAERRGAWLVLWQDEVADPNGVVPMLLDARGAEQSAEASFWQVRLRHWRFPEPFAPLPATPEITHPQEANFQNTFRLLGWEQPKPVPADRGASLRLYWQAAQPTPDDYNVALRIVDENGTFWGKLDRRPAGLNYPTQRWKANEVIAGDYTAELLPGTPAGDYYATVTLFTKQNETGLDVLAPNGAPLGKSVKVGPIQILPAQKQPQLLDLNIQHVLSTPLAPFTLLGFTLGIEKSSTGESIPLTLYWRADEKPKSDYTFQIQFGDTLSAPQPLANATYPTSQWSAGEVVRGQYLVQIPPDASASAGNLRLELSDGATKQSVDLQKPFVVEKTDRTFVEPVPQVKQSANFNNVIAFLGYDLSAREVKTGEPLTVTLYWKATGKMDKPYTVFVQLLGSAPPPQAQKDAQPLNGARPTQTWVQGEFLTDPYTLEIKPEVPPGQYTLLIGWYDAGDPTFARVQVLDANGNGAGDSVTLSETVTVK